LFSIAQAVVQAWQPVQVSRSMTIPHFGIGRPPDQARSTLTLVV
jgi:hypothetical protein